MVEIILENTFIIESCLVCLGLLIAVYTLIYPKIENIMEEKAKNIVSLESKFQNIYGKKKQNINIKDIKEITKQLNELNDELDMESLKPYELYLGFIISIMLFAVPLVYFSFVVSGFNILYFLESFIPNIFFLGILSFLSLFILIFLRLNSLVTHDFDKKIEKIRNETKEKLKEINKKQV